MRSCWARVFSRPRRKTLRSMGWRGDFQNRLGHTHMSARRRVIAPTFTAQERVGVRNGGDGGSFLARPSARNAASTWKSLLPWFRLGSLGHMHEVLAGNLFHPEVESVPEQTWSSAGFLHATVCGLFGLRLMPHSTACFLPRISIRDGKFRCSESPWKLPLST